MRVVIIGNGVAGMEAALAVREREPSWSITVVSEESDHFFSRTALMWVVSGQLSHQCIEPHERDVYERLRFERIRARATGVDVAGHLVLLGGELDPVPYDRLLIACGSEPRPAPWPGAALAGVGHFVTLQDMEWLEAELHGGPSRGGRPPRSAAHHSSSTNASPYWPRTPARLTRSQPPREAAVIGGGLVGIEAVEVLVAGGLRPRFFIREEWFWPMALDSAEARWIGERMREHGVQVHVDESVEALEGLQGEAHVESLRTDRGSYPAELVVVAIGVVPNTRWLEGSAIETHDSGGLVVDDHLRTSAEDVYAAGDCAAVRTDDGRRRPEQLWYTARDQGRVAARGLLGDPPTDERRYQRGIWYNSAKLMDIEYTTVGRVDDQGAESRTYFFEERTSVRSTTRIVARGEQVVGFNLLGRRWDHRVLARFIEQRREMSYVLQHLNEAAFDTEFVPPLRLQTDAS